MVKPTQSLGALIKRYFNRLKVDDFTQLTEEERATYDEWQEILTAEPSVEILSKFITSQVHNLESELRAAVRDGEQRKALFITARLENYNDLQAVIDAPERSREALAAHISNLLTKPINHD